MTPSHRIGVIALDAAALAPEIDAIEREGYTVVADAFGLWGMVHVWDRRADGGNPVEALCERGLLAIARLVSANFHLEHLQTLRFFCAERNGIIAPHVDWRTDMPAFDRLHISLRTNPSCLNSEGGRLYHMAEGEVWQLRGENVHSGGCFSDAVRTHLALDFAVGAPTLIAGAEHAPPVDGLDARDWLDSDGMAAIRSLTEITTDKTLHSLHAALSLVHFDRRCDAGDVYAWLADVAARTGDPALKARADRLASAMIGSSACQADPW